MRRFLLIFTVLVALSGGFSYTKTTSAQEGDNTSSNYAAYLSQGSNIFDIEITKLNNQRAIDPVNVDRYVKSTNDIKNVFVNSYNNPTAGIVSGRPIDPKDIYVQAMGKSAEYTVTTIQPIYCGGPVASTEGCTFFKALGVVLGKEKNPTPNFASTDTAESAAQKLAAAGTVSPPEKCTVLGQNSIENCLTAGITWLVKNITLNIAGFLVWVSANILNLSIQTGILEFSNWAPNSLYPIWVVVRQIVSLFVVFAGLYLGFMYIIGRENTFEKYLPWVIIFALFVNFSYPVTRALTDVSNIISLNIYTSAVGPAPLTGSDPNNTAGALIMGRLGLQGLVLSATEAKDGRVGFPEQINSLPGAIMAVVFVLYTAYVFFVAALIIIFRLAALVFLIVSSPFLFIDSVIPKLGEVAMKMRRVFFEQLAVAPIFMIMLALTLKFLEVFQTTGPLKGIAGASGTATLTSLANAASYTVFFNLLIMMVMLHIMLKVTKGVSSTFGQFATNAVGKVGSFATTAAIGMASGGTGLIARGTIGRAAAGAAAGEGRLGAWINRNQDNFLGKRVYNMANSLGTSSFDLRNSTAVAGGLKSVGVNVGKGRAGGFAQDLEAKKKDLGERYGRIKTEDKDGKINLEGMNAKARFYDRAGGAILDKEKVRTALLEKDQEEARRENIRSSRIIRPRPTISVGGNRGEVVAGDESKEKTGKGENLYAKAPDEKEILSERDMRETEYRNATAQGKEEIRERDFQVAQKENEAREVVSTRKPNFDVNSTVAVNEQIRKARAETKENKTDYGIDLDIARKLAERREEKVRTASKKAEEEMGTNDMRANTVARKAMMEAAKGRGGPSPSPSFSPVLNKPKPSPENSATILS